MSNEKADAVAAYLTARNIQFSAVGGHRTKRDDWDCFEWRCTFTRSPRSPTPALSIPYYCGLGHVLPSKFRKDSVFYVERPWAPLAADVLHSLVMDATALDESFTNWCAEFGYSDDSLSALETYRRCCDITKQLRGFFGRDELSEVSKLLEDY